jgi:hypothetical protein
MQMNTITSGSSDAVARHSINIHITRTAPVLEVLKAIESVKQIAKSGALVHVEIDRSSTSGTNDIAVRLKPSQRLVELMAASAASEINWGVY